MEKSKVYFTKKITEKNLIKLYEKLGKKLPGKVAIIQEKKEIKTIYIQNL